MAPDAQAKQKDFRVELFDPEVHQLKAYTEENKRCTYKQLQAEFRLPGS